MFWRRRKTAKVTMLDYVALSEKLREFEDAHAVRTGERISSPEFHDRYLRGQGDDFADAIEWASFYELYRAHGRRALSDQTRRPDEAPLPFAIAQ